MKKEKGVDSIKEEEDKRKNHNIFNREDVSKIKVKE